MSDGVTKSNETGAAGGGSGTKPRALVHRKILDVADENPEASLEAIADEVSGASLTFVERILDEYGDPARSDRTDASEGTTGSDRGENDRPGPAEPTPETPETDSEGAGEAGTADETPVTDASQLSERQRETLLAVAERPTATQAEIGEELGVSRATVSKRLGDIDGFEWADRRDFVERLFDYRGRTSGRRSDGGAPEPSDRDPVGNRDSNSAGPATDSVTGTDATTAPGDSRRPDERLADLESRLAVLERRLEAETREYEADPELAHKVFHACMDADYISEDEELRLLQDVLSSGSSVSDVDDAL